MHNNSFVSGIKLYRLLQPSNSKLTSLIKESNLGADSKLATIQNWENATTSLAHSVSHFFHLSTVLESQCRISEAVPNDLVARIDMTLDRLERTFDKQLIQSRLALARTRNRLTRASGILRLPEEILSEIFLKLVYDPYEENQFSTSRTVNLHVELIYRRVHTLLGVCTTWRNVGIGCSALWSVIPIVDPSIGRPRLLSTDLSLKHASNRNLHLAITHPHHSYPRIKALVPYLSKFDSMNIWSDSMTAFEINEVIRLMVEDEGPKSLSKLSLKHAATTSLPGNPFGPFTRLEPKFLDLIESLSALRVSNMTIAWEGISFSQRLTEFWISDIMLDELAIVGFFAALSSAPELQHLTIISTRAMLDDDPTLIRGVVTLPKLQTVHYESLPFNFLKQLFSVIVPQSYRLTLNPCDDIHSNFPSDEAVDEEDICALFATGPVYRLILAVEEESFWDSGRGLRSVLQSMPTVKILILNYYDINKGILKGLIPPSRQQSPAFIPQGNRFPQLEVFEIHAATFRSRLSDMKTEISALLDYHPIRRMVLGGMVQVTPNIEDSTPLVEGDGIVPWLTARVPQFYVSPEPEDAPDFVEKWQLWDI